MNIDALRDLAMAGVQWEIGDVPVGMRTTMPKPSAPRSATVVPPVAPVSPDAAASVARSATDCAALICAIGKFNHPLCMTAGCTVLPHMGTGKLMIVTDVPGADDDTSGRVLSGAAGDMMDKMLNAIGLARDRVSIVPLVFWHTPGGRTPTDEELNLARPFVDRFIELARPDVILTLGTLAASRMAGRTLPQDHGVATSAFGATVIPIYHPNFLLLKPTAKRDVWDVLQRVEKMLKTAEK